MSKWYTVSRLSDHMALTPEGFLLCKDVPIARCGTQLYRHSEVPQLECDDHGWVSVDREPSEVFRPDSLASFTGKPIVNDHPLDIVTPDNWNALAIGVVQNPRRGSDSDHDLLFADLLFTTKQGINLVRSGKRAISVGYDAFYEQTAKGLGRQRQIVCNHVALVDEGRCGPRCVILDGCPHYDYEADDVTSSSGWTGREFKESEHKRVPKGQHGGGEFTSGGSGVGGRGGVSGAGGPASLLEAAKEKAHHFFQHETEADVRILNHHLYKPGSDVRKGWAAKVKQLGHALPHLLRGHLREEVHNARHAAGALRGLAAGVKWGDLTSEQRTGLKAFGVRMLMTAGSMALTGDERTGDVTGTVGHLAGALAQEVTQHVIGEHALKLAGSAIRVGAYAATKGAAPIVQEGADAEPGEEMSPADYQLLSDYITKLSEAAEKLDIHPERVKQLLAGQGKETQDDWAEEDHPRVPAGTAKGGEFTKGGAGGGGGKKWWEAEPGWNTPPSKPVNPWGPKGATGSYSLGKGYVVSKGKGQYELLPWKGKTEGAPYPATFKPHSLPLPLPVPKGPAKPKGPAEPATYAIQKPLQGEGEGAKAETWSHLKKPPASLNGVAFGDFAAPKTNQGWEDLAAQGPAFEEPPLPVRPKHIRQGAGIIVEEPDGRVWVMHPSNQFGGVITTFPKGGVEKGMSLRGTALKEGYEESGLQVELTGYAGDVERSTSNARYYFAKRIGGSPANHGWEAEAVSLIPKAELKDYLNTWADRDMVDRFIHGQGEAQSAPELDMEGMHQTGPQLGSNPGGRFTDQSGKEYYIKFSKSNDHARNELLASRLYELAGAPVLRARLTDLGNGKLATATDWKPIKLIDKEDPAQRKLAQRNFATQAWLANWDAIGQTYDNQGIVDGKMATVDPGGALIYRAQGELKGSKAFGNEVNEWHTLRDPKNHTASAIYGEMTPVQMRASAWRVQRIPDEQIRSLVMTHGPGSQAQRDALANKLIARKADLWKKANDTLPQTKSLFDRAARLFRKYAYHPRVNIDFDPNIDIGYRDDWVESEHPRVPAGSPEGGEFTSTGGGAGGFTTASFAVTVPEPAPSAKKAGQALKQAAITALQETQDPNHAADVIKQLAAKQAHTYFAQYANKLLAHIEKAHGLAAGELGKAYPKGKGEPAPMAAPSEAEMAGMAAAAGEEEMPAPPGSIQGHWLPLWAWKVAKGENEHFPEVEQQINAIKEQEASQSIPYDVAEYTSTLTHLLQQKQALAAGEMVGGAMIAPEAVGIPLPTKTTHFAQTVYNIATGQYYGPGEAQAKVQQYMELTPHGEDEDLYAKQVWAALQAKEHAKLQGELAEPEAMETAPEIPLPTTPPMHLGTIGANLHGTAYTGLSGGQDPEDVAEAIKMQAEHGDSDVQEYGNELLKAVEKFHNLPEGFLGTVEGPGQTKAPPPPENPLLKQAALKKYGMPDDPLSGPPTGMIGSSSVAVGAFQMATDPDPAKTTAEKIQSVSKWIEKQADPGSPTYEYGQELIKALAEQGEAKLEPEPVPEEIPPPSEYGLSGHNSANFYKMATEPGVDAGEKIANLRNQMSQLGISQYGQVGQYVQALIDKLQKQAGIAAAPVTAASAFGKIDPPEDLGGTLYNQMSAFVGDPSKTEEQKVQYLQGVAQTGKGGANEFATNILNAMGAPVTPAKPTFKPATKLPDPGQNSAKQIMHSIAMGAQKPPIGENAMAYLHNVATEGAVGGPELAKYASDLLKAALPQPKAGTNEQHLFDVATGLTYPPEKYKGDAVSYFKAVADNTISNQLSDYANSLVRALGGTPTPEETKLEPEPLPIPAPDPGSSAQWAIHKVATDPSKLPSGHVSPQAYIQSFIGGAFDPSVQNYAQQVLSAMKGTTFTPGVGVMPTPEDFLLSSAGGHAKSLNEIANEPISNENKIAAITSKLAFYAKPGSTLEKYGQALIAHFKGQQAEPAAAPKITTPEEELDLASMGGTTPSAKMVQMHNIATKASQLSTQEKIDALIGLKGTVMAGSVAGKYAEKLIKELQGGAKPEAAAEAVQFLTPSNNYQNAVWNTALAAGTTPEEKIDELQKEYQAATVPNNKEYVKSLIEALGGTVGAGPGPIAQQLAEEKAAAGTDIETLGNIANNESELNKLSTTAHEIGKVLHPITPEATAASNSIKTWTDPSGYKLMQNHLRAVLSSPGAAEHIGKLDKAMAATATKGPVQVWRGIHGPQLDDLLAAGVGGTYTQAGYTATTLDPKRATHYAKGGKGGVLVHMSLPEGTHGLYTSHPTLNPGWENEREFLLPHGGSFKVLSKTTKNLPEYDYSGHKTGPGGPVDIYDVQYVPPASMAAAAPQPAPQPAPTAPKAPPPPPKADYGPHPGATGKKKFFYNVTQIYSPAEAATKLESKLNYYINTGKAQPNGTIAKYAQKLIATAKWHAKQGVQLSPQAAAAMATQTPPAAPAPPSPPPKPVEPPKGPPPAPNSPGQNAVYQEAINPNTDVVTKISNIQNILTSSGMAGYYTKQFAKHWISELEGKGQPEADEPPPNKGLTKYDPVAAMTAHPHVPWNAPPPPPPPPAPKPPPPQSLAGKAAAQAAAAGIKHGQSLFAPASAQNFIQARASPETNFALALQKGAANPASTMSAESYDLVPSLKKEFWQKVDNSKDAHAFDDYGGGGYSNINGVLRFDQTPSTNDLDKIDAMQALFQDPDMQTTGDILLVRGENMNQKQINDIRNDLKKGVTTVPYLRTGFTSASIGPTPGWKENANVWWHFVVKKGSRVMGIAGKVGHGEREVLLPHGVATDIFETYDSGGHTHIWAVVR
jgi:ADP-ribose pyrophosphatase YjhB (NUDIX family)